MKSKVLIFLGLVIAAVIVSIIINKGSKERDALYSTEEPYSQASDQSSQSLGGRPQSVPVGNSNEGSETPVLVEPNVSETPVSDVDNDVEKAPVSGVNTDGQEDVPEKINPAGNTVVTETGTTATTATTTTAAYLPYDAGTVQEHVKDRTVVLFFHAAWCPTCRSLDREIAANLSNIPNGVSIFKVDYDAATDLKRTYKVTYQHTLVEVDENLALVRKWSGGGLDEILFQLNS